MPELLRSQLDLLSVKVPTQTDLCNALQKMYAISTHINRDGLELFAVNVAMDPSIYTVTMEFFEVLHDVDGSREPASVKNLVKVICYASLFCLNVFRMTLADRPASIHHNLILRMRAAIETGSELWYGVEDLYLWCLCQGGITAWGIDRMFFVHCMRQEMNRRGDLDPRKVMGVLEKMFFLESLFKDEYTRFGEEVMALDEMVVY